MEVFNNYFGSVSVPETHCSRVENFSDHPSVLGIVSRQVLEHPFTFEPVSSSYVKEILDNLNARKTAGAEGISSLLLRLSAPVMAEEITRLINFLIANRSWPDKWRFQRSMRKLCTINFIILSVATCHKTSLDF